MESTMLIQIRTLVSAGKILISEHGYDELSKDDIRIEDVVRSLTEGIVIEDYPKYHKGPCILTLQRDRNDNPIHVVWGIPFGQKEPAVLVTAYRPDINRWSGDYKTRRRK